MKLIALLVFLMLPAAAQAQTPNPMECQLLPIHIANQDVAYKPGVDVRGKPVVPADLNAPTMELPRTIVVPLSVDMADRLQSSVDGLKLEAPLGMVEIHPNGRVVYNDKDLTPQVYALCGREAVPALKPETEAEKVEAAAEVKENEPKISRKPVMDKPAEAEESTDGQATADTIKSDAVEVAPTQAVPPDGMTIEGGESRQEGYRSDE